MTSGGEAGGGRLIDDRYFLTERLGSGAMGTVWAGFDRRVGREVAVKEAFVRTDLDDATHRARVERVLREAKAAARAAHGSVVAVYDVVVEDERPWIVMERVYGRTLSEVLAERGPLAEAEAAAMLLGVAEALVAAHDKGVVHRDVKPSNIMLGDDGRVLLTDFGVAYIEGEPDLTRSGEVMGSVAYMAPERMSGRHQPGPAADLWSLGVVLHEMLEGVCPFRRDSIEGTVAAVLMDDPPPALRAPVLGRLVAELLVKEPGERASGTDVVARLRSVAEAPPAAQGAPGKGTGTAMARARRRTRMLGGLGVTGLTAAALILVPMAIDRWGSGEDSGSGPNGPARSSSSSLSPSLSSPSVSPSLRPSLPPSSRPSSVAHTGDGLHEVAKGTNFTVEVPRGWQHLPENEAGQNRFSSDDFALVVVAGRDEAGADPAPLDYQQRTEPELAPVRTSVWSTTSGVRTVRVGGRLSAEGSYTWTDGNGREVYARNKVIVIDDRYHVLLVIGPGDDKEKVDDIADRAAATYTVTR
ncbi:protein kinase domain-containing protein [Streptomyces sp. NPDC002073]